MNDTTFKKQDGIKAIAWLSALIDDLDAEKTYKLEVKEYKKKRSLDANAYAWVLITKIAENQGIKKEEVYRQHIKDVGVYRQVEIDEKAVDTLVHSWKLHGIGWVAEKVDYTQHDGFVLINLYYGSSTYNSKQMCLLIDNIIQDCKALNIETMTDRELSLLKDDWETKTTN